MAAATASTLDANHAAHMHRLHTDDPPPSSSSATHAELLLHQRHTPDGPATHAVEHKTPGRTDTRYAAPALVPLAISQSRRAKTQLGDLAVLFSGDTTPLIPATGNTRRCSRPATHALEPSRPARPTHDLLPPHLHWRPSTTDTQPDDLDRPPPSNAITHRPPPARLRRRGHNPARTSSDANCWNQPLIHSDSSLSHARTEEEDDEQCTHDNGDERPGRTNGLYVGFYFITRTRLNQRAVITRPIYRLDT